MCLTLAQWKPYPYWKPWLVTVIRICSYKISKRNNNISVYKYKYINLWAHKHKQYKYKYGLQIFYRHEQNTIAHLSVVWNSSTLCFYLAWDFFFSRNFPCGLWENVLWIALSLLFQHESLQNCSWRGEHSTCTWFLSTWDRFSLFGFGSSL